MLYAILSLHAKPVRLLAKSITKSDATLSAQTILNYYSNRWPIEVHFQQSKTKLAFGGFICDWIGAAYPRAQIHRYIIHQIRSSTRYVSYKHIKELMVDLKLVYQAVTEEAALNHLIAFKEKWGKEYPSCVRSWEENWDILSTFYAYPAEIRRIIYTTNIIEGLNCQFRQITKNKPSFINDDSLKKMLFLAAMKIGYPAPTADDIHAMREISQQPAG